MQIDIGNRSIGVVVDPLDEDAVAFYKKFGFIMLPDSEKMFLPMADVALLGCYFAAYLVIVYPAESVDICIVRQSPGIAIGSWELPTTGKGYEENSGKYQH